MTIDTFTLCDGVYCYEDKLTIVGVYDVLIRPNFTAAPVNINIAAHITFGEDECGDNTIRIYGVEMDTGTSVLELNNKISITKRDKIGTGILNVSLSAIPVVFPRPGKYKFILEIEGKGKSEIILTVA